MIAGYNLTHQAARDLRKIWAYIAQDNLIAADTILNLLYQAFSNLGRYPGLGQHRPEFFPKPLRFLAVRNYLIAYNPEIKPVIILRVLSHHRNIRDFF